MRTIAEGITHHLQTPAAQSRWQHLDFRLRFCSVTYCHLRFSDVFGNPSRQILPTKKDLQSQATAAQLPETSSGSNASIGLLLKCNRNKNLMWKMSQPRCLDAENILVASVLQTDLPRSHLGHVTATRGFSVSLASTVRHTSLPSLLPPDHHLMHGLLQGFQCSGNHSSANLFKL